jgi:hypothetical protein
MIVRFIVKRIIRRVGIVASLLRWEFFVHGRVLTTIASMMDDTIVRWPELRWKAHHNGEATIGESIVV